MSAEIEMPAVMRLSPLALEWPTPGVDPGSTSLPLRAILHRAIGRVRLRVLPQSNLGSSPLHGMMIY